jgi:hypothetical protein
VKYRLITPDFYITAVGSCRNDGQAKYGESRIESACFRRIFIDVDLTIV